MQCALDKSGMTNMGSNGKMDKYTVYKHTSPNGKVYIGITMNDPLKRWNNGNGYVRNKHFYRAIQKYGWQNFKHEILHTGLTHKEACEIEKKLIASYKSNDKRYGFNITDGGDHFTHSKTSRKLMSENRKGKGQNARSEETRKLMRQNHKGGAEKKKVLCVETGEVFESIRAAANYIGKGKCIISACCNNKPHYNTAGGYHWRYV